MHSRTKQSTKKREPSQPAKVQGDAEHIARLERENTALREALEQAQQERDALAKDMLTPLVFERLLDWLREPKPASAAFTAGIERQIAYALEMDILPEVKSLRIRLANAVSTNNTALIQSIEADAQAFEATLANCAERVPSPVYPWGWFYRDAALQWQFREFCKAKEAAPGIR